MANTVLSEKPKSLWPKQSWRLKNMHDPVNHPKHYTEHPSGVECIEITEHMGFCIGNAIKYLWRAGLKGEQVEDLRKARWYIDREIARVLNGRKRNDEEKT
jgi:hypothetical protein